MQKDFPISPRILDIAWGRMEVQGFGTGKDFKLWPGGGREWNWRETGTRHVPGIQPGDVAELIENGCRHIVISRGMLFCLQCRQETLDQLEAANISVHVAETRKAVDIYNDLVGKGQPVGGLFHSTC